MRFAKSGEDAGDAFAGISTSTEETGSPILADCLAWLATLASLSGIDLEEAAVAKYERGCPRCSSTPCACA